VAGLQYLTLTRPNISFVVNKVCQFLASPLLFIMRWSSGFFITFGVLLPLVCFFGIIRLQFLMFTPMRTGLGVRMTAALLVVMLYLLGLILFHGALASNLPSLVLVPRKSPKRLPMTMISPNSHKLIAKCPFY
jgi:hypothetical protein